MTGLSLVRALTGRGRALAAIGLVSAVLGVLAAHRDLLRVGALLLALPCVALAVLARGRVRLACTRELTRASLPEGGTAGVRLRVENVSRLTTGVLLLSDRVPRLLGDSPRFLLAPVQPGRGGQVEYALRGSVRGRYEVGPLAVRLVDPFGLCELVRVFPGTLPLVVTPAVEDLPAVRLGGDRAPVGDGGTRTMALAGDEDFSTREWRQGDDLRKVHWRSTARTGELMVRQEEQPSRARAVLLLDARARSHVGSGASSTLETAVRAAASVAVHLLRTGSGVRLLPVGAGVGGPEGGGRPADGGRAREAGRVRGAARPAPRSPGSGPDGSHAHGGLDVDGEAAVDLLLERLAVLTAGRDAVPLAAALGPLQVGGSRESLLVAVLGRLDVADADALARLRSSGRTCVAVVTAGASSGVRQDGAGPDGAAPGGADPVQLLRGSGWRVLALPPGARLAALWPSLGDRAAGPDPGAPWRGAGSTWTRPAPPGAAQHLSETPR